MPVYITLRNGNKFDILDPKDLCIYEIANTLSNIARFGGRQLGLYSVAQHSVEVANKLPKRNPLLQLHGLLHDISEAYIGDIVTPIKSLLTLRYRSKVYNLHDIEHKIISKFYEEHNIPLITRDQAKQVKDIDIRMQATEFRDILKIKPTINVKPFTFYKVYTNNDSYNLFMNKYTELINKI